MSPRLVFRMACWSAMSASRVKWVRLVVRPILPRRAAPIARHAASTGTGRAGRVVVGHDRMEATRREGRSRPWACARRSPCIDQAADYVETVRPQARAAVETAVEPRDGLRPRRPDRDPGPHRRHGQGRAGARRRHATRPRRCWPTPEPRARRRRRPPAGAAAAPRREGVRRSRTWPRPRSPSSRASRSQKKGGKLRKILLITALAAAGRGFVAKKLQGGGEADNWQSSYTPPAGRRRPPGRPTPAAPPSPSAAPGRAHDRPTTPAAPRPTRRSPTPSRSRTRSPRPTTRPRSSRSTTVRGAGARTTPSSPRRPSGRGRHRRRPEREILRPVLARSRRRSAPTSRTASRSAPRGPSGISARGTCHHRITISLSIGSSRQTSPTVSRWSRPVWATSTTSASGAASSAARKPPGRGASTLVIASARAGHPLQPELAQPVDAPLAAARR